MFRHQRNFSRSQACRMNFTLNPAAGSNAVKLRIMPTSNGCTHAIPFPAIRKKLFRSRRKANMSDKFVQFVVFLVSFGSSLDSAACRVASNMTHECCERGRFSVFSTFPSRHSTIIVNEVIYGECESFSWL